LTPRSTAPSPRRRASRPTALRPDRRQRSPHRSGFPQDHTQPDGGWWSQASRGRRILAVATATAAIVAVGAFAGGLAASSQASNLGSDPLPYSCEVRLQSSQAQSGDPYDTSRWPADCRVALDAHGVLENAALTTASQLRALAWLSLLVTGLCGVALFVLRRRSDHEPEGLLGVNIPGSAALAVLETHAERLRPRPALTGQTHAGLTSHVRLRPSPPCASTAPAPQPHHRGPERRRKPATERHSQQHASGGPAFRLAPHCVLSSLRHLSARRATPSSNDRGRLRRSWRPHGRCLAPRPRQMAVPELTTDVSGAGMLRCGRAHHPVAK